MDKSFRAILAEIACDLSEDEVKALPLLFRYMDPGLPPHKCKTASELFDQLEKRGLITPEDPTPLKKALKTIGRTDLSAKLPDATRSASHGTEEVSLMGHRLFTVVDRLCPEEVKNLKHYFKVPQGAKIEDGIDLAWYLIHSENLKNFPTALITIHRKDLANDLKEEEETTHTYKLPEGVTSINRDNLAKTMEEEKNTTLELEAATRGFYSVRGWQLCRKNPGHKDFIPVVEFALQHLPLEWQREDFTKYIKVWADLTVRLRVFSDIAGVSVGTGFVTKLEPINKPGHVLSSMSWNIHIVTSQAVIRAIDKLEIMRVDFFHDYSESLKDGRMKTLKGGIVVETNDASDLRVLSCVCYDNELASLIMYQIYQREKLKHKLVKWLLSLSPRPIVIVSHLHGGPKQVTVGELRDVDPDLGTCLYTTPTCPGSSGAPLVGMFGWERNPFTTSTAHHCMVGSSRDGTNRGFFE